MAKFKIRFARGITAYSTSGVDRTTDNIFLPLAVLRTTDTRAADPSLFGDLYDTIAVQTRGTVTLKPTVALGVQSFVPGPNVIPLTNTTGVIIGDIVERATTGTIGTVTAVTPGVDVTITTAGAFGPELSFIQGGTGAYTSVSPIYDGMVAMFAASLAIPGLVNTTLNAAIISIGFPIAGLYTTNFNGVLIPAGPGGQGVPVTLSCGFRDVALTAGISLNNRSASVDLLASHGGLIILGPNGAIPFNVNRAVHRITLSAQGHIDLAVNTTSVVDTLANSRWKCYSGQDDPTTNPALTDGRYFIHTPQVASTYFENGNTVLAMPLESNASAALNGNINNNVAFTEAERIGYAGPTNSIPLPYVPAGFTGSPSYSKTFVELNGPTGNVSSPTQVTRLFGYQQMPCDVNELSTLLSSGDAFNIAYLVSEYDVDIDDVILTSIFQVQGKVLALQGTQTGDCYFQNFGGNIALDAGVDWSIVRATLLNNYIFVDLNYVSGTSYLGANFGATVDTFNVFNAPVAVTNPLTEITSLYVRAIGGDSTVLNAAL